MAKKTKVNARACACGCTKVANVGRLYKHSEFFQLPPEGTKAKSSDKELCETIMGFIVPVTVEKPMWRDHITKPVQKNIEAMGEESSRKHPCINLLKAHVKSDYIDYSATSSGKLKYDKFKQDSLKGRGGGTSHTLNGRQDVLDVLNREKKVRERRASTPDPMAGANLLMQRKMEAMERKIKDQEAELDHLRSRPALGLHTINDENIRMLTGFPSVRAFELWCDLLDADGYWSSIHWGNHDYSSDEEQEGEEEDNKE